MRKFYCVLVALFLSMALVNGVAAATDSSDLKKLVTITEEIRKEYLQQRDTPDTDFRDFDFNLIMVYANIKSWNDSVGQEATLESHIETSKIYASIIAAQYVGMKQYVEKYVIEKNKNPKEMQKKCKKILKLIDEVLKLFKK